MRTPSLRRRVLTAGTAVVLLVLVAAGVVVFLGVRSGLEDSLDEVLQARTDIAVRLGVDQGVDAALADRLTALGIPARITTADGVVIEAEPVLPRFGQGGVPTTVPMPRVERTTFLPSGDRITVYATRAGVEATMRSLAATLLVATGAGASLAVALLGMASDRALAPLGAVADVADRTRAGNADERLRPDRPDTELGRLAVAFDFMVDRLGTALDEAVREQDRTQRFLADAAHQLRTPLAGLQASVESLLRERDPVDRDRLMGNIVRETGRSARLVNALLRMAYLDQGDRLLTRPTDLVELVRGELARTADLAPHLEVSLEDETEGSAAAVEVDAQQLREALGNLLDNARRHARSRVDVTVARTTDLALVQVTDDGPGVAPADVPLIFDRFATLDGKGGSGLGLPIARGVARAHGGDVSYEAGTFVLSVPLRPATEASATRTAATSPSSTT